MQGNSSMDSFTHSLYGPTTMHESAQKISQEILRQAEGDAVIVMAHNGPRGLGSRRHDPCGKDFRPEEGAKLYITNLKVPDFTRVCNGSVS